MWVWVKIRYPKIMDGLVPKLDIHICGPTSVFHFDPHPCNINHQRRDGYPATPR